MKIPKSLFDQILLSCISLFLRKIRLYLDMMNVQYATSLVRFGQCAYDKIRFSSPFEKRVLLGGITSEF